MKNLVISATFWIVLISGILYGVNTVKETPDYKDNFQSQYTQLAELEE